MPCPVCVLRPGFLYTAAAESAITFVDATSASCAIALPIEQLAEHSTTSKSPTCSITAKLPTKSRRGVKQEVTTHTYIHEERP